MPRRRKPRQGWYSEQALDCPRINEPSPSVLSAFTLKASHAPISLRVLFSMTLLPSPEGKPCSDLGSSACSQRLYSKDCTFRPIIGRKPRPSQMAQHMGPGPPASARDSVASAPDRNSVPFPERLYNDADNR